MRNIITDDMFLISEIIDKMEIELPKIKYTKDMTRIEIDQAKYQASVDMLMLFFKKIYKAKKEVYCFIAAILEKSENEVKKMPLSDLRNVLSEILKNEEVLSFFKSGSK